MSEQDYYMRIQREITPENCRIIYSMSQVLLGHMLADNAVERAEDLPESFLRELCARASSARQQQFMDMLAERNPNAIAVVVGKDTNGNDLGWDVLKRLAPEIDAEQEMRCDPAYSAVGFELRVFEGELGEEGKEDHILLSTTLYPPNLAS